MNLKRLKDSSNSVRREFKFTGRRIQDLSEEEQTPKLKKELYDMDD